MGQPEAITLAHELGRLDGWYGRGDDRANAPTTETRSAYAQGYEAGQRHQEHVRQGARRLVEARRHGR